MSLKDRHYWAQLRAALTAGQWSASSPAKAYNGSPLSWSELFRKFNKHCKGYTDVAEVASQTQALSLLLGANYDDQDQNIVIEPEVYPIELGDECMLPEERISEAEEGYNVLKNLESSNFDTLNFALAYYAYALGKPSECLSHLKKIPDISHVQNHIPLPATLNASTLNIPGSGISTSTSSASTIVVSDTASYIAEIKDGRGWAVAETLRTLCLQGMSHEKLSPTSPQAALRIYAASLPLLTIVETEFTSNVTPTAAGKLDFLSFTRFREVWRWVERLLWRAICLGAKTLNLHHDHRDSSCKNPDSIWPWLEHYSNCSVHWPSNFRTAHRSSVSVLYLRALVLRHGRTSLTPNYELANPPQWMHVARGVIQEYRAILTVSTRFPKAGERNAKVEDFSDLCVAVWEASGAVGEYTSWVLDVLWWATRLTFNSFRVQRHMTRLLYVSGDIALAKRTLRLYVQIVSKAHQAAAASGFTGHKLEQEADTPRNWVNMCVFGARMLCKTVSSGSLKSSTPMFGSSMNRTGSKSDSEDLREAGMLISKARERLDVWDKELVASVDLVEGVWCSVMAVEAHDPHTRSTFFSKAHTLFIRCIDSYPAPAGHYHLAISYARFVPLHAPKTDNSGTMHEQDLQKALENAAAAAEGDPTEIRYWHLLGLLSAKIEQWEAAEGALNTGAMIGEVPGAESLRQGVEGLGDSGKMSKDDVNGQTSHDGSRIDGLPQQSPEHSLFRSPSTPNQEDLPPVTILPNDEVKPRTTNIPPSSQLLRPTLDYPRPSRHEQFEYALQLRMTQLAVTEYIDGAEGAADLLPDVYQWIAEKRGTSGDQTHSRASIDIARSGADMDLKSPSELAFTNPSSVSHSGHESIANNIAPNVDSVAKEDGAEVNLQPPIPITISPATPDGAEAQVNPIDKQDTTGNRLHPQGHDRDASKSKKMQQILKSRVHKGSARISTISKKIGHGVVRNGSLRRSSSTPDFHSVLRSTTYQASSIHSRRRLSSSIHRTESDSLSGTSPPPPPPPPAFPPTANSKWNNRTMKENRLLSDLWLMSAAMFRRLGKIEQAKGAIQEAEVRDEANPGVWVQLGLYYVALGHIQAATDAFQKALFIAPHDIAASVHLSRLYLFPEEMSPSNAQSAQSNHSALPENVDLAAGLLSHLTRGVAWDVPEAWYFLAKAYGMQGRKDREQECLTVALRLSETRGVRDIGVALGLCL